MVRPGLRGTGRFAGRGGILGADRALWRAGLVPILRREDEVVWDSLAIAEALAEAVPEAALWPGDPVARNRARSVSAEMHSGFTALRSEMPMDVGASWLGLAFSDAARRDCERIVKIWTETRACFGTEGPFLFGRRSIADAMFAPVVFRFETYGVALDGEARRYSDAVSAMPELRAWRSAAESEEEETDLRRGVREP